MGRAFATSGSPFLDIFANVLQRQYIDCQTDISTITIKFKRLSTITIIAKQLPIIDNRVIAEFDAMA